MASLVASFFGAHWLLNQPASGTTPVAPPQPTVLGIVGHGYADVEGGITFLHPTQVGRVESVWVNEGDEVKEGDLLLSLDNSAQKNRLIQAEAELAAAKLALSDAKVQLAQKWKSEIDRQTAELEIAKQESIATHEELRIEKKISEQQTISKERLGIFAAKAEGLKAKVKANEATLDKIKASDPQGTIDRARWDVKAKQAQRDQAHLALVECDVYAPADGTVLRVFASPGEILSSQPRQSAIQFCPSTPRIVRTEVLQEFAGKIQKGQIATIEDDARAGVQWKGKVVRVSDWFAPRRQVLPEPFQFNDVRTLECIVALDSGSPPIRINQRVRVTIRQGGP
jgi:multidrug resistance efflux pump